VIAIDTTIATTAALSIMFGDPLLKYSEHVWGSHDKASIRFVIVAYGDQRKLK